MKKLRFFKQKSEIEANNSFTSLLPPTQNLVITGLTGIKREESDPNERILVSDYAVMQGAEYERNINSDKLSGEHWIRYSNLKPMRSKYHDRAYGVRALIKDGYIKKFCTRGGFLTYDKKYVSYPQERVDKEMSDYLTQMVFKTGKIPSGVDFSKLDCEPIVGEKSIGVFYQLNGYQYCLCSLLDNSEEPYQWYRVNRVRAKLVDMDYLCKDILFADHKYNPNKFIRELMNSIQRQKMISQRTKKLLLTEETNKSVDEK